MTSEQRLDRLERIAKLFVCAGLRARRNMKERFAKMSQSIEQTNRELSQSIERSRIELSQSMNELARAQIHTSGRLDALIEIVRRDRNGSSN